MLKFDRELINTMKRGVSASILTAGRRDQPVFKSIFNYMLFQRLIRNNVSVYETTERMLHSKVYLFDGKYVTLGSMNNDRWSWKINNEANIWIHDSRECEFIQTYFDEIHKRTRKVSKEYTISSSRAAAITFWQKFLYLS
jgi:cardiolipin synthase